MARSKQKGAPLNHLELSGFCAQIALILGAGIPLAEGLSTMLEEAAGGSIQKALEIVLPSLEEGTSFYQALDDTGFFPSYLIQMTEIGEKTGRLEDVMDSLSLYYQREEAIQQSVKSAVTYPMVMVLVMLAVIGLLVFQVLPIFNSVFRNLGAEMSGFPKSVMDFGMTLSHYAFGIISVLAALVILYLLLRGTSFGKRMGDRLKAAFPPTREIANQVASGRFASAMSLMLSSGLDPDESLDMVYRLADTGLMRNKIEVCRARLAEGASFPEALTQSHLFSGIYAQMVGVGFRTGSVDTVMERLASRYEDDIDEKIASFISILEPTLVIILSVLVGLVLLSVMLPLMGVMSSIG